MQIVEFNREKKQYMNEKEKITKRILHKNFISNCIYTATITNHHRNFPEKTSHLSSQTEVVVERMVSQNWKHKGQFDKFICMRVKLTKPKT